MIASPNFRFDAASFLTKNGVLNIVEQLSPNTKNLRDLQSDAALDGLSAALSIARALSPDGTTARKRHFLRPESGS